MMKPEFINDWVTVSQNLINKPESKNVRGVKIQFMLPPSDVPSATRAWINESEGRPGWLAIDFKYLTSPEPQKMLDEKDGTRFLVGKNSGRIYQISFDIKKLVAQGEEGEIQIRFGSLAEHQVDAYTHSFEHQINQGNADAIKRLLDGPAQLPIETLLNAD